MTLSRRFVLLGSACGFAVGALAATSRMAIAGLSAGADADSKALLQRMIRVMYPHDSFPDAPYARTAEAVIGAANKSVAQTLMFNRGMAELKGAGFAKMDGAAALAHLTMIQGSDFFQLVRGTTILTLYNDPEVWDLLGYEGASYDKGGYIDRGFNDLDWLPEPRVTEL
ncbi:MAG: hypothetical protein AAF577_01940 [Pseudomonadota bacterium]